MSPEGGFFVLIPLLVVVGVGLGVAGVIYLVGRVRSGQGLAIPLRPLLLFYLYLLSVVSLVVGVIGLSQLVRAGLSLPLGREFSYFAPQVHKGEVRVYPPPPPYAVPERAYPPPQGPPPRPTPDELEAQRQKTLERSFREGVLGGVSYTVIGGLLFTLHLWGRRRLGAEVNGALHRLYLIALLLLFAIITVVTLPPGLYEALRYYWVTPQEYYRPPGSKLATALVALPFWFYYLRLALLRQTPEEEKNQGA